MILFLLLLSSIDSYRAPVDIFIGSQGTGHVFVGPTLPFGKIQISPDCGLEGWAYTSGYQHGEQITRISHTHISGAGAGSGGDIGWEFNPFVPLHEEGEPGYYKVIGPHNEIIELTVSESCGIIRYYNTFLTLDLKRNLNWDKTHSYGHYSTTFNGIIKGSGYRKSTGWGNKTVYFRYLKNYNYIITCIDFEDLPELQILNFEEIREKSKITWNNHLNVIETSKNILSTALYHATIHPSRYNDQYYSQFSTWDTYRSHNSMMIWLYPQYIQNWTLSLLRNEYLPVWQIWGQDSLMMAGCHSISMVCEYILKGLIPPELVWDKIDKTLHRPDRYYDEYYSLGYIPKESSNIASSMVLEHAYTDYCLEQVMIKYNLNLSRSINSQSYKNIFSEDMFYNRKRDGSFDKYGYQYVNHGFEEASAWGSQWSVLHNFKGLISLHDYDKDLSSCSETLPCEKRINGRMLQRLEEWFNTPGIEGQLQDLTDCQGQYCQSNQPHFHVIYLFTVIGYPERACRYLKQIASLFTNKTDGIPGNSDLGSEESWLIYSALGFYPVSPCSNIMILACPVYPEPLKLKNLLVTNNGNGYNPTYYWNNKRYNKLYITFDMVLQGGHLHVELN